MSDIGCLGYFPHFPSCQYRTYPFSLPWLPRRQTILTLVAKIGNGKLPREGMSEEPKRLCAAL
jgi:hypothetical protein